MFDDIKFQSDDDVVINKVSHTAHSLTISLKFKAAITLTVNGYEFLMKNLFPVFFSRTYHDEVGDSEHKETILSIDCITKMGKVIFMLYLKSVYYMF